MATREEGEGDIAMIYEFKLPDIGEGLHEAEIIRWLVREGDVVNADQPIAEIQTDKAMVEMTTPVAGKVVALAGPEGATVKVGEPLIVVEIEAAVAGEAAPTEDSVREPVPAARGEAPRPARKRAIAAPSVRKRARELGVPINEVEGTGEGGRVTLADLERYVREREAAATVAARDEAKKDTLLTGGAAEGQQASIATWTSIAGLDTLFEEEERVPLRGLRKKIAEKNGEIGVYGAACDRDGRDRRDEARRDSKKPCQRTGEGADQADVFAVYH